MGAMNGTSPVKFVLISGHDNTLMPLLAAITPEAWDREWPPYASLLSLELLRISPDGNSSSASEAGEAGLAGDFFRLVYNGEVLRLRGCDAGESERVYAMGTHTREGLSRFDWVVVALRWSLSVLDDESYAHDWAAWGRRPCLKFPRWLSVKRGT